MLKTGILNPRLNYLLSRVRRTNKLVITDRGFPFWPQVETVDNSLVDGVPTVLQVQKAIRPNFTIAGRGWRRNFCRTTATPHKTPLPRRCTGFLYPAKNILNSRSASRRQSD